MANHTVIPLETPTTPEAVERACHEINVRRFQARMRIERSEWIARAWQETDLWEFVAPNTRPKVPSLVEPDEDRGFIFWLHKDRMAIEIRHIGLDSWIRWVQDVFTHELAKSLGVERFDFGDGDVDTDPDQYGASFMQFVNDRMPPQPWSDDDRKFAEIHFLRWIPEGWAI